MSIMTQNLSREHIYGMAKLEEILDQDVFRSSKSDILMKKFIVSDTM
jgi:hypothetical protein